MKLWEAMLKGAKAGKQLFNKNNDGRGGTCAMGAVIIGAGYPSTLSAYMCVASEFPELNSKTACPEGTCVTYTNGSHLIEQSPETLSDVIVHLNNDHRWSRQRIAEWLANRELKFKPMVKESKSVAVED